MINTEAAAGTSGASIALMNEAAARDWIAADSVWVIKMLGPKLAAAEQDLFQLQFQSPDSRVAALLLRLAGDGDVLAEITHESLGEMIGVCREMVCLALSRFRTRRLIETRRRSITILNKGALRELSEM